MQYKLTIIIMHLLLIHVETAFSILNVGKPVTLSYHDTINKSFPWLKIEIACESH